MTAALQYAQRDYALGAYVFQIVSSATHDIDHFASHA